ncbi:hypothetical protein [Brevibacillus reuszeri]|uniref:hypothetical protein n=1 Tax=Brevibacillus reuszeri TaxID=54915 RepID=UPI00114144CE|nr:hypothetical protein [Brevibacillus reuszeri]MED1859186.1 hypothetical protein [Brevibacillus reuszeri]
MQKYAWDDEELCYEHEDIENVVAKALDLSKKSGNDYTYRMETWKDGKLKYQFRFFQNGKEFTQDLISAITI